MNAYKLTPEVADRLRVLLREGVSTVDAARAVRVHERTLRGWLHAGRAEGAELRFAALARAADEGRTVARRRPPVPGAASAGAVSAEERDRLIRVVVERGLSGDPKYALEALRRWPEPQPEPEPERSPTPIADWLRKKQEAGL